MYDFVFHKSNECSDENCLSLTLIVSGIIITGMNCNTERCLAETQSSSRHWSYSSYRQMHYTLTV